MGVKVQAATRDTPHGHLNLGISKLRLLWKGFPVPLEALISQVVGTAVLGENEAWAGPREQLSDDTPWLIRRRILMCQAVPGQAVVSTMVDANAPTQEDGKWLR
jgi:hypothetical protein